MKIPRQEDRMKPYENASNKPPINSRLMKQTNLMAQVEAIKENATEEFTTNQNTPSKDSHQVESTPI